ncbi:peptide ABC transporter substrate-binding protein [Avibacterium sp. 20-15]|uniref:peptide ABC transporter substrate-binding protein n=1 Tax=unclassified Avibacterium TaxID=2685287 RepID=UPI002027071B|nr:MULTISPECIES: peptide ABC transporter substrate-binding protein [unclassified Avibacterium]MCW9733508.1 peptide ABC transporter substrate-binding protein [Avibacterium sp. 20-15]URL03371.1 peptide ABC transporter substrate-binding protein [Avibacterium sp. 20-132]
MPSLNVSTILPSAVFFCVIFGLTGCDKPQQVTTPHPTQTTTTQTEPEVRIPRLVRGVYGDLVISPDKLQNDEQAIFLRDILEGLVIYDPHGNVIPAVAESWQTKDNKTWIFTLRESAKWSNGLPVTAEDFVQSWRKLATSNNPLKKYLAFINIQHATAVIQGEADAAQLGVQALSPQQLQITLEKAIPYLPAMLAHPVLLPQSFAEQQGFVSNGAYYVKNQQGDEIHLAQNPYYWQGENVAFSLVDYKKLTSNQELTGIDIVANPTHRNVQVTYFPKLCTYYYEFNFNDPRLAKSAVRKSLVFLASTRNLVRGEPQARLASNHFLPISMQGEPENAWSPVLVEQLLQQNGITEKSPLVLRLTFDQEGINHTIGQRLVQMWSQSDLIHIQADPVPWQTLLERRAKGDFQIIRSGWCADYNDPSAFLMNFYSKNPDNKSAYHNEKVDALLEQSLQPISTQKRTALYQQVTQLLQQDNVVLPVFQYTTPIYLSPNLQGIDRQNPTNVIYSKDLKREY